VAKAKATSSDLKNYLALFTRGKAVDLRGQLERQNVEVHSAQGRLITALRKLAQAERAQQRRPQQNLAELDREYKELVRHPDIERIVFEPQGIRVYTKLIVMDCGDHYHEIGKFRIELNTLLGYEPMMHNLTRRRGGHDHPRVVACVVRDVAIKGRVASLIRKGDICKAVGACIKYLKEPSSSLYHYEFNSLWPEIRKGGASR
jgi:hypothetical protein